MSGLPTVTSISCPTCGAKPGGTCVSHAGKRTTQPHSARSKAFRSRIRKGARFIIMMRHDVPEHGLSKGDQYLCQAIWTAKHTVKLLHRVPDGHRVDCVQYDTAVRFIEWEV